jgi:hypothetical protein
MFFSIAWVISFLHAAWILSNNLICFEKKSSHADWVRTVSVHILIVFLDFQKSTQNQIGLRIYVNTTSFISVPARLA